VKKRIALAVIAAIVVVITAYLWNYRNYVDYLNKTVHETSRWAVIIDSKGDIIAVETTSDEVWDQLVDLHRNPAEMWIGGVVEVYENTWGFRFKSDTIIIAQITIEGAQSNIRGISEDLDYWINTWAEETYVLATVTEVHE
jgi:hypothetical protein